MKFCSDSRRFRACFICESHAHLKAACPYRQCCYRCLKPGHMASSCCGELFLAGRSMEGESEKSSSQNVELREVKEVREEMRQMWTEVREEMKGIWTEVVRQREDAHRRECQQLEGVITGLRQEISSRKADVTKMRKERDQEAEELQKQLREAQEKLLISEKKRNALRRRNNELQAKNEQLTDEKMELEDENLEFAGEVDTLTEEVKKLQEDRRSQTKQEVEEQLRSLTGEMKRLEDCVSKRMNQLAEDMNERKSAEIVVEKELRKQLDLQVRKLEKMWSSSEIAKESEVDDVDEITKAKADVREAQRRRCREKLLKEGKSEVRREEKGCVMTDGELKDLVLDKELREGRNAKRSSLAEVCRRMDLWRLPISRTVYSTDREGNVVFGWDAHGVMSKLQMSELGRFRL
eukprot:m.224518 g.224518  ORF g.224518 m.224518 type:complete len:407 (+) comp39996_c0_seq9:555-1775(+)